MTLSFPAWFYGPEGAARIFERADDVPEGWADAPAKIGRIHALDRDRDGAKGGPLPSPIPRKSRTSKKRK
jgi:hypothetical protein